MSTLFDSVAAELRCLRTQDMERIYMWLANMDASIDSLVMTANVYTEGLDFSALSSAYVRVANADTNQEHTAS